MAETKHKRLIINKQCINIYKYLHKDKRIHSPLRELSLLAVTTIYTKTRFL